VDFSIAVIIPTFNNKARLRTALEHWGRAEYAAKTIVVVNDGCSDGTKEMLDAEFPGIVQLFGDGNLWFAGSCNMGLRYALENAFDYATVYNDDNYVQPDILRAQADCAAKHPGAVLGVKSYKLGTNKMLWAVGGNITKRIIGLGITWLGKNTEDDGVTYEEPFDVDTVDGSGQFYPLQVVRAIGFWDERYKTYWADAEYAYRAKRKGFRVVSNPKAVVWHDYEESAVIKSHIRRYRFELLYLLFNKKSAYNLVNAFRFWFTYFPFSAPLTLFRIYGVMFKMYYVDPVLTGKRPPR
jgi:GT2 family glycosyltransferase